MESLNSGVGFTVALTVLTVMLVVAMEYCLSKCKRQSRQLAMTAEDLKG